MVLITKKNWGGWITASSTDTLTNKTLDDYTNFIHADWVHLRVKAIEPLSKWDVIKFVWFNNGEQAIEVAKRDSTSVPAIWVVYTPMDTWDFGMAVSNGLFKWIDTSSFTEWTVLYPNTSGWFTSTNPWWYAQQLAYVVRSHAVNGEIMINVWPVYGWWTIINKTETQTRINESWDEIILSEVPIEDITVMKNRVIQYKDIDYEITGGVTITFFTSFSNADIMILPYMY